MDDMQRQIWYLIEDKDDAADAMEATVRSIENAQADRVLQLLKDGSLYRNRDITNIGLSSDASYQPMPKQIVNLLGTIVDTQVSKHVQAETKVSFQTEDADFEAHQCAQDMDKFCWGEFERLRVHWKGEKALLDACWAGDGWLKWYEKNGRAACDKPFPLEILIDDAQCMGTEPQEMYQVRYVARSWALQFFPELAGEIENLPTCYPPYSMPNTDQDVVRLIEGWHLASEEGAKDGRHILSVGQHCVIDEKWTYTTFPFSRIPYMPALIGAYSDSLVGLLRDMQLEYGKLWKRIQHSIHLMSVPRVMQAAATKITPEYNNGIGNVMKYTGPEPRIDTSAAVNPELYSQLDRLHDRMLEVARTNPMQNGNMPSRFDSRPALREAQEIADEPHAWLGQNWERFFVDCGQQIVRLARQIVKEHGSYKSLGKDREFLEEIDWANCNLDDNQFVIKPTPSSLLPTKPTGKRLVVQDLMQAGLIQDPNDAWELLAGMPDVDAYKSEKTAQKRLVDKQLLLMCKRDGEDIWPDDCQDPEYCKRRAQATLQNLLTKRNVPDDVLSRLDKYIARCDQLYLQANPPAPPPSPEMMGAQAGAPGGAMPNGQPAIPQLPPGPGPGGAVPEQPGQPLPIQ